MYEDREIELDLLALNIVEKYSINNFNRRQIVTLMNFKINDYEIEYFMDRVNQNIKFRNQRKYFLLEKKINKNLFQQRLFV